jgi:MFS family permease
MVVAISSFAGIWAGPVGGWISDRIGRLPIIIFCSLISGIIIFTIRLVPYGPGLFAMLLLSGINMYMNAPVAEAFIMGHTAAKNRSMIYGLYYLAGQGGALFAPLMGLLIDLQGYQFAFTISGAAVICVSIICGIILWSTRKTPLQAV